VKINIGDYCITGDEYQMTLNLRAISRGKKSAGKEILKPLAYFRTIDQCISHIVRRKLAETESSDLKGVIDELKRIEAGLYQELGLTPPAANTRL